MADDFDFSQSDRPDKDFNYYLMKAQQAREQMTMGYNALKEEYTRKSLKDRIKDRLRTYGMGQIDPQSIYTPNEQGALLGSDFIANSTIKAASFGLGAVQLGSSFMMPTGKLGNAAMFGSMFASGGLATGLGTISTLTNPYATAAVLASKAISFGVQDQIIDPLANSRLYQSTINNSLKGVIGGLNSNSGRGGMDLHGSFKLARSIQNIGYTNKDISTESINKFVEAGASLPQMGNLDSDKVAANMGKFVNIMVNLSKKFKGKENDLLAAMQQFSQMGMSLDQAERNILTTSQLGKNLNVDPNRIMMSGANIAQSLMGTNISQATGYGLGSRSFIQAEIMRQRGQFSKDQMLNFGGSEGIGQVMASSSMALLNSNLSDVFLKTLYTKGGGINQDNLRNLSLGNMGLREAQFKSQNVTLSPETNMKYQFDKQSIISNLGDNAFGISNNIFNQLATRNPWGNSLQGRAKYAMQLGISPDMQSARIFAQQNMSYNPMLNAISDDYKMDQQMAGNDPFYSSQAGFGRFTNQFINTVGRSYKSFERDSLVKYVNTATQSGRDTASGFGRFMTMNMGRGMGQYLDRMSSDVNIRGFKPYANIEDVDQLYETTKFLKNQSSSLSKEDIALDKIGRSKLYGNYDLLKDEDRDMVRNYYSNVKDKYRNELWDIKDPEKYKKRVDEIYKIETKGKSELTEGYFTLEGGSRIAKNSEQGRSILTGGLTMDFNLETKSRDSISAIDKTLPEYKTLNNNRKALNKITGEWYIPGSIMPKFVGEAAYFLTGQSKDEDRYNLAKDKFDTADITTRKKMIDELDKKISEAGDEEKELGNDFKEMFNFSSANKQQLQSIRDPMGKGISMQDIRIKSLDKTINMIYGSEQAKTTFSKYGNENIGLGIVQKFMGFNADKENLKIGEKELSQLRKDFGNDQGLGGIIKIIKLDADGNVDFNQMSEKKKKGLMSNLMAKDGGITDKIMSTPKEIWEHHRFDKAVSINDFSIAVAKGMLVYDKNKGANGEDMQTWTKTENEKVGNSFKSKNG